MPTSPLGTSRTRAQRARRAFRDAIDTWSRTSGALLGLISGCSFTPPAGSAEPPSTADGGVDAAPGAPDCTARWQSGTVRLAAVEPLTALSGFTTHEGDPMLSRDGLTLLYSGQGLITTLDVYQATRPTVNDTFTAGTMRDDLSDAVSEESRATLAANNLVVALATDRGPTSARNDIYLAARATALTDFQSPTPDLAGNLNTNADQLDPELSPDGLRIYFANGNTDNQQTLMIAERTTLDVPFAAPQPLLTANDDDADPTVTANELVLIFTSSRSVPGRPDLTGGNLWFATRSARGAPFSAPQLVPEVNGKSHEGDAAISGDGCELLFASDRDGSSDLFRTVVIE